VFQAESGFCLDSAWILPGFCLDLPPFLWPGPSSLTARSDTTIIMGRTQTAQDKEYEKKATGLANTRKKTTRLAVYTFGIGKSKKLPQHTAKKDCAAAFKESSPLGGRGARWLKHNRSTNH